VWANAHNESSSETAIVPMVIVAAKRRCGRFVTAMTAAAASGSAGINQRFWMVFISASFLQKTHF
jgi:hypothetical protein